MKRERRVGVLVNRDGLWCVCVFRGQFLEHFSLGRSEEEAIKMLGKVKEEINASNFGVGEKYEGELEEVCGMILDKVAEKINKASM